MIIELTKAVEVHPMDDMAEAERRERIMRMQNGNIALTSAGMAFGIIFTVLAVWFFRGL